MITTSFIKKFEQIIADKGDNRFYNKSDNKFKSEQNISRLLNIFDNLNMINTNGLNEINSIPNETFEQYIINMIVKSIPTKLTKEVINDESNHVSSLSKTISCFHSLTPLSKIFYESKFECNLEEEPNGEFIELKQKIIGFKKSVKEYGAYMGHFFEDILSSLLSEQLNIISTNKTYELTEEYTKLIYPFDETLSENGKYILNGIQAVIHEVLSKDNDSFCLHNFIYSLVHNDQNITVIIDKYIKYLRKQVDQMFNYLFNDDIGMADFKQLLTKHRVDYMGISGETDYIITYDNNHQAILIDCKVYNDITEETLNRFLFQLIGYYQQHNLLRCKPSYKQKYDFDINYLLIINPLDENFKFSYYVLDIQKYIKEFTEMVEIWDGYINKCLNCNKSYE